jgi:hypothetical protein
VTVATGGGPLHDATSMTAATVNLCALMSSGAPARPSGSCDTAPMPPTQSAVVVAVPEAESAVGTHRAWLDHAAAWGVPAHVTVLYPFLPPAEIDDGVLARLRAAIATVPAFDTVFARASWFGDDVLYLAPEPDAPFRALMTAVWEAFPDHPPYGGEIPDVVPHLTVGQGAPLPVLRTVAEEVTPYLPIPVRVATVTLIQGAEEADSWHTLAELPLAQDGP